MSMDDLRDNSIYNPELLQPFEGNGDVPHDRREIPKQEAHAVDIPAAAGEIQLAVQINNPEFLQHAEDNGAVLHNRIEIPEQEDAHVVDIPAAAEEIQPAGPINDDALAGAGVDIQPDIDGRRIYRVPPYLRGDGRSNPQQVYDPVVLSLGPYHHGQPQFLKMEEIKEEVLNSFIAWSVEECPTKDRRFFYGQIIDNIDAIRNNYEEVDYKNDALAEIILRDSCFFITYITVRCKIDLLINFHLGMPTTKLLRRDLHMLENQIPFWVIKHFLNIRFGENRADAYVCKYINFMCALADDKILLKTLPWKDEDGPGKPLHFIEAYRTVYFRRRNDGNDEDMDRNEYRKILNRNTHIHFNNGLDNVTGLDKFEMISLPRHSVTYLQAKGIYFRPSSQCLQDIKFTSYYFYGILHLPVFLITHNAKVFFSNVIAFELSPRKRTNRSMSSYVNFMKSLIDTPEDVKELRERGILYTTLESDEEVVRVFKENRTYGMDNHDIFAGVKMDINRHCRSKAKTWMADLTHNYCRSPWSAIAVVAAGFLICLTFLQTYYTIHPFKSI